MRLSNITWDCKHCGEKFITKNRTSTEMEELTMRTRVNTTSYIHMHKKHRELSNSKEYGVAFIHIIWIWLRTILAMVISLLLAIVTLPFTVATAFWESL